MVRLEVWPQDWIRGQTRHHTVWQLAKESHDLGEQVDIVSARRLHKIVLDMLW